MYTADFDYELPAAAIAQRAVEPRDAARLLDTRDGSDHYFRDLAALLEPGDLVVVNSTKVRAARLITTRRDTSGRVEVLLLERLDPARWSAMLRPSRRMRPGIVLESAPLTITVVDGPEGGIAEVEVSAVGDVEDTIATVGSVPLPPYFTGDLDDESRYQTMFARRVGSAAAPTAGLHFTGAVVTALERRGVEVAEIDLHVGLDTFRPISATAVEDHVIHREHVEVAAETVARIEHARERGGRIVAVGTTVVRALESAACEGALRPRAGPTDLYITPGYRFGVVDVLITNFHAPRTTLLVMLEAFMGPGWRQAYAAALRRGYRFLSFGDAMLAVRA